MRYFLDTGLCTAIERPFGWERILPSRTRSPELRGLLNVYLVGICILLYSFVFILSDS